MLFDLRTYKVKPGALPAQVKLYEEYGLKPQTRHLGQPLAWMLSESGEMNTYVHIWAYKDAADRETRRAAMAADPDWQLFLRKSAEAGSLVEQTTKLMTPASFMKLPEIGAAHKADGTWPLSRTRVTGPGSACGDRGMTGEKARRRLAILQIRCAWPASRRRNRRSLYSPLCFPVAGRVQAAQHHDRRSASPARQNAGRDTILSRRECIMTKRRIGRSDLYVAPFCFGGNVFGWTADEATSFRLLDTFVDNGFDFIDTADVYSIWAPGHTGGESETVIGRWLKKGGKRNKVVVATKVGMQMGPDKKGLKPDYVFRAVDDSLRRLQTDHIDLYQSHTDDDSVAIEETLRTYELLIKAGKVRVIGASNFSAARLNEALDIAERTGLPRYECLQPHYNLMERDFETDLGPLCRDRQVGVIPYFSLAAGFLTGKYRNEADLNKSVRGPRTAGKYLNERGHAVLRALDESAANHKATPAQVALAWLMAKPGLTAPIASATRPEQLLELLGAANVALDARDMAALDAASA